MMHIIKFSPFLICVLFKPRKNMETTLKKEDTQPIKDIPRKNNQGNRRKPIKRERKIMKNHENYTKI